MVLKIHICKHTTVHWRDFSKSEIIIFKNEKTPHITSLLYSTTVNIALLDGPQQQL